MRSALSAGGGIEAGGGFQPQLPRRELPCASGHAGATVPRACARIRCRCNNASQVVVEVQGQLRLGMSDVGVNGRRNEAFMLALSRAVQQGQIPEGACVPDDRGGAAGRRR